MTKFDWAIITPSYDLDFVRCKLLCRSIDELVDGQWHHYLIVDAPDMALFALLNGPRRTVIAKADVLPKNTYQFFNTHIFKSQRFRRLWWSRSGPVAGWQVQQLVKIGMANHVEQENLLLCDSDMFFVKRFALANFHRSEKFRVRAAIRAARDRGRHA